MKIKFSSLVNLFLISAVLGSGVGYSHLYLFHVCLLLLVGGAILLYSAGVKRLFLKPKSILSNFFLLMIFWYASSLFWSIEPFYTLRYLVYIIFGVAIVYVIVGRAVSEERYQRIFNVLKWAFLLEIIVAIFESFTPFRLPTSPYSEYAVIFCRKVTDFGLFDDAVTQAIKSVPTAFHGNPNNLAIVMTAMLPFFLFHHRLMFKVTGSLSVLIVIVMAGSRGAFIGAVFGMALYFAITNIKRFLVFCLFGLVLSSVLIGWLDELKISENRKVAEYAYTADVLIAYLDEEDTSGGSISVRQQLLKNGLDALYFTNGLGVGGGGSNAVQERLGGVEGKIVSMHNFWIEVLVDAGVVFFLLFVLWYLTVCFKLLIIYLRSSSPFYKYHSGALFVSFSAFSVACVSASSVIYHLPMWIMLGMGLALINVHLESLPLRKLAHRP
ncbi:MAG: O-antigen ligase family protein [Pseudomonadota bacterium]